MQIPFINLVIAPELANLRDKDNEHLYARKNLCQIVEILYKLTYDSLKELKDEDIKENAVVTVKKALAQFDYDILRLLYLDNNRLFYTASSVPVNGILLEIKEDKFLHIFSSEKVSEVRSS